MQRIGQKLTEYIFSKGLIQEEEKEIYDFGFQAALESAAGIGISIFLAALCGMVVEGILFYAIFIPLRSYAGGLHLKHFSACLIFSCLTHLSVLILSRYLSLSVTGAFFMTILFIFSIWIQYPSEHVNRPVDEEEDKYFRKKLRKYLLADIIAAVLFFRFQQETCMILMALTLFLVSVTMALGKVSWYLGKRYGIGRIKEK